SVTFLDDGDDFELEDVVSRNYLNTTTGDLAEVTSTKVRHTDILRPGLCNKCSGDMVVPTDGGLVKGQAYYARVFAYSPVGFSQGQVAPDPAKPTTVPGRPTSVSVEVYDAQSLKVVFSPPADDGGDTGTNATKPN
ncbi:unnamed protein product, partial [Scytosiphon promiscuus]